MKNKVTKKLMAVALASAMVLGTAACGSKDAGNSAPASSAASSTASSEASSAAGSEAPAEKTVEKPDTISWWTHDGLNEENGSEQWFAEFEKFTGIHLDHQFIPNNEYYDKLKLAFASDEVPEVFDLNGANLALYASQGAIYDLTDLLKASELYDKVDPAIWEAISINGRIYSIPKEMPSAAVTYVRGDWLERLGMKAPTNYEEFLDMIRRFKEEIPECEIGLTAPGVKSEMNLPEFYQGAHYGFQRLTVFGLTVLHRTIWLRLCRECRMLIRKACWIWKSLPIQLLPVVTRGMKARSVYSTTGPESGAVLCRTDW